MSLGPLVLGTDVINTAASAMASFLSIAESLSLFLEMGVPPPNITIKCSPWSLMTRYMTSNPVQFVLGRKGLEAREEDSNQV